MKDLFDTGSADFSECRRYRYRLERTWSGGEGSLNFLMLNPSTADEFENDPTVERCERRAQRWGFNRLIVTNIFAWRDTSPADMKRAADPIGPRNNEAILAAAKESRKVICAWGIHGAYRNRGSEVQEMLEQAGIKLWALRLTTEGVPYHPLYLPYDLSPCELPPIMKSK